MHRLRLGEKPRLVVPTILRLRLLGVAEHPVGELCSGRVLAFVAGLAQAFTAEWQWVLAGGWRLPLTSDA